MQDFLEYPTKALREISGMWECAGERPLNCDIILVLGKDKETKSRTDSNGLP